MCIAIYLVIFYESSYKRNNIKIDIFVTLPTEQLCVTYRFVEVRKFLGAINPRCIDETIRSSSTCAFDHPAMGLIDERLVS